MFNSGWWDLNFLALDIFDMFFESLRILSLFLVLPPFFLTILIVIDIIIGIDCLLYSSEHVFVTTDRRIVLLVEI